MINQSFFSRWTHVSLALLASTILADEPAKKFELKDTAGDHLDIIQNGKTFARWMYAHDISTKERREETYKPYLHVFDAEGTAPITKGPGGQFPHHRGLFLGWMKITVDGKSYDRWHMKGGDQVQEKFLSQSADAGKATFTSRILWQGEKPETNILEESRTLSFLPASAPGYGMIDMTSVVKAVAGDTKIDGDPEHAGLQFRPAGEVVPAETVYIYPVDKAQPHKDLDYPWVGETFTLAGKKHSVIYLNHPDNPKGTVFSAYRDYGRFGGFFKTDVAAGKELTLKVRIVVVDGEMPPAEFIQKASNEFTGQNAPVPTVTVKPAERSAPPKPAK